MSFGTLKEMVGGTAFSVTKDAKNSFISRVAQVSKAFGEKNGFSICFSCFQFAKLVV